MTLIKIILFYPFIALVLLLTGGCREVSQTRELKLAHGLDISHPVHKGMVYMAGRLKDKSGGKLTLRIYPSEQLGTERQCLEMLQIGSLDMTKVSAAIIEGFVPKFQIFGLPYIFRNKKHTWEVLTGDIGEELLMSGEKFWLRGLTFYDAGSRSFYTIDQPVNKPEDLNGLKIRVMESITAVKMVRALGGSPTPISWGELYTSLQNRVVDGAENNPPSFYLSHHYEVCKFYSLDEHTTIPDVLMISTHTWNHLTGEEQKWIKEAAEESLDAQLKYWKESELEALEEVQKAGVEILYPDKAPFLDAVKPVYEEYKQDYPDMYAIVERIQNLAEKSDTLDN